ncbi:hypothetical protein ACU635_50880 [[Actinomadura] parvosata]|uniref:hypothetical protein n=1 Tax=[Actinomadura] parvosata TaxID=1955412 RepID=UPI00406CDB9D
MRLELDLSPGGWPDYKGAGGDLKRVGVLIPTEPVGVAAFVRLGVLTDDGQALTVLTPWLIWKAAHRALAEHFGEQAPAAPTINLAPPPDRPPVLDDVEDAMREHQHRWGLDTSHPDGTDAEAWQDDAADSRHQATSAAMTGDITWAHTLLEAVHAALAAEKPEDLTAELARVAGAAANWMNTLKERS